MKPNYQYEQMLLELILLEKNRLMRIYLLLIISFIFMHKMTGQDLDKYQWNNRLLLVFTTDQTNMEYRQQLNELVAVQEGLIDRKLIIYQVMPGKYKMVDYSDSISEPTWKEGQDLFEQYMDADDHFRVVLIGLDGTVKHNNEEVFPVKDLFLKIDAMPMRRAELRRRKR